MSTKALKAVAPLNDSVCRALELCEQFDSLSDYNARKRVQEEAKTILFNKIPRDSQFPAFVNRNSDFYRTFLELREIVKRNDANLLEERFKNIRRGSQSSTIARPNLHVSTPSNGSESLPYPISPLPCSDDTMRMPEPNNVPVPASNVNKEYKEAVKKNGGSQGNYEVSPSIVKNKLSVSKVLLIDVRKHEEFEKSHIKASLIACIEPDCVKPGMSESDMEDALVLSGASEFDSFAMRDQVDMIVLYDQRSMSASDSLPLDAVYSTLKAAGRYPYVLKGGFQAWQAYLSTEKASSMASYRGSPNSSSSASILNSMPPSSSTLSSTSVPPEPPIHQMFSPRVQYSRPEPRPLPPVLPPKESLYPSAPSSTVSLPSSSSPSLAAARTPSYQPPRSLPIPVPNTHRPPPLPNVPPPEVPAYASKSSPIPHTPSSASLSEASTRPRLAARTLSGYADAPPKSTLPSLRVPKLFNAPARNSSLSPSTSPPKAYSYQDSIKSKVGTAASATLPSSLTFSSTKSGELKAPEYTEEKIPPKLLSRTGLKNMGNTCYMNCIIQCLLGVPQLTSPFIDGSFVEYINFRSRLGHQGRFATVFANLVKAMTEYTGGYVAPIEMKNLSGELRPDSFAGYDQQDCQEFLTFILDGLHEDLNLNGDKPKEGELNAKAEEHREAMGIRVASAIEWERYLKGDTSLIVDLFQGQYLSRLQCMTCKRTSTTYNAFSSLSLPIASPKLLGQQTSLKTCFDEFVKPELLDGDNAWFCPHCQKKRRTIKTLQISRLPLILVIHLKRFKRSSMHGVNKLETAVDYPLRDLDLTRYWPQLKQGESNEKEAEMLNKIPLRGQKPPFIYDLRAVTLHHGSLKSGHYTAVVQKPGLGWLYYDDANVYPVKEQAAVSKQAYVLFYKRRM